jgi:hypothetical protein
MGEAKLQVQPCPQCPVSDGRPEKDGPVVMGQFLPRAPAANDVRGCNALLDHLVGATKQRQREGETERLGGLKIDNELDFCKQLDGQV